MNLGMTFIHPERKVLCVVDKINSLPFPGRAVLLAYVVAVDNSFSDYVPMDLLVRDESQYCAECGELKDNHPILPATETSPAERQCFPAEDDTGEQTSRDVIHDYWEQLGWQIEF